MSQARGAGFVLVIAVLVLFLGLYGFHGQRQNAVTDTGNTTDITNETRDLDPGQLNGLQYSNKSGVVYSESVTIYNSSTEIVPDTEYTWNRANGTITVASSTTYLSNTTDANVSYSYSRASSTQSLATQVGLLGFEIGEALLLLFAAVMMLASVGVVSGMMPGRNGWG